MPLFGLSAIGVDLGSFHTAIYLPDQGLCLREGTRCLVNADNPQEILAVGSQARAMQSRTRGEAETLEPIQHGAVADVEMAALLMMALIERASEKKKNLEKCLLCVTCPSGLTRVERDALYKALTATGAKRMAVVKSPVAALLGAGVDVTTAKGTMVVTLGGGVTEIAVVSMGAVAAARTIRMGGQTADEDIVNWFWREKGVVIGMKTAEQLKRDMGAASEPTEDETEPMLLRGRSAKTGEPCSVEITAVDVHKALMPYVTRIVDAMKNALRNVPEELAADIRESGVQLSGGGAMLKGLKDLLREETGVPIRVSPHPADDGALGIGGAATDDSLRDFLINAGSADEIG